MKCRQVRLRYASADTQFLSKIKILKKLVEGKMKNLHITIDVIDKIGDAAFKLVTEYVKKLPHCHYADIRAEASEHKSAVAIRGEPYSGGADGQAAFGVRVIAGKKIKATGYCGYWMGMEDIRNIEKRLKEGIDNAYWRAMAAAEWKYEAKKKLKVLGKSLWDTTLAPVEICQEKVTEPVKIHPRDVTPKQVFDKAVEISRAVQNLDSSIAFNELLISCQLVREFFASSEGAKIEYIHAQTFGFPYIVAQQPGRSSEAQYDHMGDLRGWEVIEGDNVFGVSLKDHALDLGRDTVELSKAEVAPFTDKEQVIVTNPHYNCLKVHEIVGHPLEADRILKMETGYAGRSWFYLSPDNNMFGKRVASPLVNVYADPTIMGYGHYKYDAEGVKAKRVTLIEKGILKAAMNSRETAEILGQEPNGSMRAQDPMWVPLIRMTNVFFGKGDRDPQDIISEVDDGWYLENQRVPSISESRENFRISAKKTWRIKNGKMVKLYRGGGMSADSYDYLMSIDALGNDFKLYPVPNCGKGVPMQAMRVGNGGPTMRGRGKISGGKK